jgi:ubiquinone/menaquinone biosynthesis C-methylase UbiE
MPEQKIIDTPENWDVASQGYAKNIAPFMMEPFAAEIIDRLDVDNQAKVLEVAAGSGALTLALSKKVDFLLATDFSPKMLELLGKRIRDEGIENTSLEVMDGQALNINDASYDRAVCSFGIMLFPERHKGFSELVRVLRPQGKAVICAWAGPDKFEAFGLFMQGIQKAFPEFPKPAQPLPVFSLSDPVSFKEQMEDVGFRDVEVEFVAKKLVIDNFETLWTMLTVGAPPVKILFDQVGEDGIGRIHDALVEIIKEQFGNGPISVTNVATVGYGNVA